MSQPSPVPIIHSQLAQQSAGYNVRGNTIYDANGKPHIFHGLNRPSLEWSSTGEHLSLADYRLMAGWKANVIRLPLSEKYWIQDTDSYQATVAQQVSWINSLGMDVILDLHWSDGGKIINKADQYNMADADSETFWKAVAGVYKSNPRVLFELYNEPRGISSDIWRNGGQTDNSHGGTFQAVGMQQLYNDVRSSGASNLVLIGGTNWAYDFSELSSHKIFGNNIVYATHPYDYYGKNTAADWDKAFGALSASAPVMMTEFGTYNCSTALYSSLLNYAKAHNISWTGWAWYPGGCSFPALIDDWSGTPSGPGQLVKNAM